MSVQQTPTPTPTAPTPPPGPLTRSQGCGIAGNLLVVDPQGNPCGIVNLTPEGYRKAAPDLAKLAPSPGVLDAESHSIIYPDGPMPQQDQTQRFGTVCQHKRGAEGLVRTLFPNVGTENQEGGMPAALPIVVNPEHAQDQHWVIPFARLKKVLMEVGVCTYNECLRTYKDPDEFPDHDNLDVDFCNLTYGLSEILQQRRKWRSKEDRFKYALERGSHAVGFAATAFIIEYIRRERESEELQLRNLQRLQEPLLLTLLHNMDTTIAAAGPYQVWRDLCETNKGVLMDYVRRHSAVPWGLYRKSLVLVQLGDPFRQTGSPPSYAMGELVPADFSALIRSRRCMIRDIEDRLSRMVARHQPLMELRARQYKRLLADVSEAEDILDPNRHPATLAIITKPFPFDWKVPRAAGVLMHD